MLGSRIRKFYQIQILTTFCVPKRVFFCEKKPFYLKASLRAFSKRVFFHKNKIPFTRLKSLFFNTFSPFSINLEPKRGMLLLFWCFLKLLAVVDHSQMRSWGNFFLSERSVNVHWTHTIPAAGMVWGFTECSLTSLPNPILFPQKILNICLCWWKHHMMEKTSWIESQGFSLTNDRFRNQQKYSNTCKW